VSPVLDFYLPGSEAIMLLPNLTFMLLIIIEGCAGPTAAAGCGAKNFSVRIPYEKLEQCEAARKNMNAGGAQQYVVGLCLAIPKEPKG
jgi:hypothetical protein